MASQNSYSASAQKQYYLITNVQNTNSSKDKEIDLHSQSWELPYTIDDSDLTFDGKPLNMLYEENRWVAEHETRDARKARGRSRKK